MCPRLLKIKFYCQVSQHFCRSPNGVEMNQPCTVTTNNYVTAVIKRLWKINEWITHVRLTLYSQDISSQNFFKTQCAVLPWKTFLGALCGCFRGGKNNACKVAWTVHVNNICATGLAISGISKIIWFSTSNNAILGFWLVHCISVPSHHYTYVWPYMEINAENVT